MLGQRRRRRPNIKPALVGHLASAMRQRQTDDPVFFCWRTGREQAHTLCIFVRAAFFSTDGFSAWC